MRRRREAQSTTIPAHLLTFRPSDWGGTDTIERWRAWHAARREPYRAVPEAWPHLVSLMAESYAVRRVTISNVAGC